MLRKPLEEGHNAVNSNSELLSWFWVSVIPFRGYVQGAHEHSKAFSTKTQKHHYAD